MYSVPFDYLCAHNIQEALKLLSEYGEEGRVIAGGQSLIPLMKLRLARPKCLVDIKRVPGLSFINKENGHLKVGALTTHRELGVSDLIRSDLPIMHEAAQVIADPQVRNLGTLVGALCQAEPSGDWAPVVLALGGRLKCVGQKGERVLEAKEFFVDAYTTLLQPGEILTEVNLPIPGARAGGAYLKVQRRAGDFAVAGVAVQLTLDEAGLCKDIGIGLSGAGLTPLRAVAVEELLRGRRISAEILEEASRCLAGSVDPISDLRGSSKYKTDVLKVTLKRAVQLAASRSKRS
ncbi:MAG: xanthine dehydrogenase family protein subunit M [Deltaproteobacteria bacterium]|nr:xanthine dehydrogenase family protein subunit M [Deltaproteobacteria bacterium]